MSRPSIGWHLPGERSGFLRIAAFSLVLGLFAMGCQNRGLPQKPQSNVPAASASSGSWREVVVLSGSFERASRATSGQAHIVRRGERYELVLSNIAVAFDSMVRVYLVGHDRASSTYLVDSTELKYDMAELQRGAERQVIELPSEPDSRLRSVVLYSPTFGINLGFAPLRSPSR